MSARAVPLGLRASLLLVALSLVGVVAFGWPLLVSPDPAAEALAHHSDAPWLFALVLPLLLALLLAELGAGRLDAKAVAVLGVLAAAGAVLRLASGGLTGVSLMFFLLVPAGRVLGPGFGFLLGTVTMCSSALITGGVGPWMPFQMLAMGWVGLGAGLLPPARGRGEVAMLATYGALAGFAYGLLLNLWFWPFTTSGTAVSFVPGGALGENLGRFWAFHLATSLGFDVPRAAGNAVLIAATGAPVLAALRRTARRAAFGARARFDPAEAGNGGHRPPAADVSTTVLTGEAGLRHG